MGTILSIRNLWKVYPNGTIANNDVSVDIEEGSIHAVVGENGAGKTTLMKVVFGITPKRSGSIFLRGEPFEAANPSEAISAGIGMVHQHLMLAPELTVAENMVLGVEPRRNKMFFDFNSAVELTRRLSEDYQLKVPADARIDQLPIGIRQRVEILKALHRNAELLILDEPTAVLTPQETDSLFKTLEKLKAQGKTIVFISHKLKEVTQIADVVTVMRAAKVVDTQPAKELTTSEIAEKMVGHRIDLNRVPTSERAGDRTLRVENLSCRNMEDQTAVRNVSFDVRGGEILGVAGVEGNGQTELVRALVGLLPVDTGRILVGDTDIASLSPRQIRNLGLSHIPEDRMEDGVAETATLKENLVVDGYYKP
ncbi:MAG: ABC transporter ATP-binding protein, partial [Spirochaetia bacterium]